jgi:hypothetical protein
MTISFSFINKISEKHNHTGYSDFDKETTINNPTNPPS